MYLFELVFSFFSDTYPGEHWRFNLEATFLDVLVVGELKIIRLRIL